MARRAAAPSASLDFAFFHFLWRFYQSNRGTIRSHYKELTRKFLDFNNPARNPKVFLRQPQFEALEIYIFLKEFLGNAKVEEIFQNWFEKKGIREFNRLDTELSEKQLILLVNKGREGWNCRSLFGVGLFREPKSRVFVLQATMRCLRSVGQAQYTGHVFLSNSNLETLNEELEQNFHISADELQKIASDTERVQVRVVEPAVTIKLVGCVSSTRFGRGSCHRDRLWASTGRTRRPGTRWSIATA